MLRQRISRHDPDDEMTHPNNRGMTYDYGMGSVINDAEGFWRDCYPVDDDRNGETGTSNQVDESTGISNSVGTAWATPS